ncbi:MAG: hypothetical protein WC790_01530 [Candidatus Paceibacterota bacterium]|jgi:hypothetical protein
MKNWLKKYWAKIILSVAVVGIFTVVIFNDLSSNGKDGYHWEVIAGKVVKVKIFVPPPGTTLMKEAINGVTTNYYGITAEQQP